MQMQSFFRFAALAALGAASSGCLAIKTEHEVKPIQITMDVNLKVDKALDQELDNEAKKPSKGLELVKPLVESGKAGIDERGYVVAREDLGDEERDAIDDMNAARRARIAEIASETGAKRSDVETRRAQKMLERLPAGTWYRESAAGPWLQKR